VADEEPDGVRLITHDDPRATPFGRHRHRAETA
jgi:hypothetical protein